MSFALLIAVLGKGDRTVAVVTLTRHGDHSKPLIIVY